MSERFWRRYEIHPLVPPPERPRVAGRNPVTGLFASDRMAYDVAGSTPDPELPMVTIADLGILREVRLTDRTVTVTITPASSSRPVAAAISAAIRLRLTRAGFYGVTVRTQLAPAWSNDWITSEGRRKLAAADVALPSGTPERSGPGRARAAPTGSSLMDAPCPAKVTGG
jgi:ring-1,2-phenylacetyl-CoA epoxidase subunit PaaD